MDEWGIKLDDNDQHFAHDAGEGWDDPSIAAGCWSEDSRKVWADRRTGKHSHFCSSLRHIIVEENTIRRDIFVQEKAKDDIAELHDQNDCLTAENEAYESQIIDKVTIAYQDFYGVPSHNG